MMLLSTGSVHTPFAHIAKDMEGLLLRQLQSYLVGASLFDRMRNKRILLVSAFARCQSIRLHRSYIE